MVMLLRWQISMDSWPGPKPAHRSLPYLRWHFSGRHWNSQKRPTVYPKMAWILVTDHSLSMFIHIYPCLSMFHVPPRFLTCVSIFQRNSATALDISPSISRSISRCHQVTTFNHTGEDVYCFSSPNTQPFVCGFSVLGLWWIKLINLMGAFSWWIHIDSRSKREHNAEHTRIMLLYWFWRVALDRHIFHMADTTAVVFPESVATDHWDGCTARYQATFINPSYVRSVLSEINILMKNNATSKSR